MSTTASILQALSPYAWPFVAVLALFLLKGQLLDILKGLADRLNSGAGITVGNVKLSAPATKTSEVNGEVLTRGDPDQFVFICGAKGRYWKKSTKAIDLGHGCLVQVSTESGPDSNPRSVSEALAFVPGARIVPDKNGGAKLVAGEDIT
jgi:hypothetical protein